MPREQRIIILDYKEIYKAMVALSVEEKRARPMGGCIMGIVLKASDGALENIRRAARTCMVTP